MDQSNFADSRDYTSDSETEKSETLKQKVTRILFDSGYPDYAIALNGFTAVLPIEDEKRLCCLYPDGKFRVNANLTDDELGLAARLGVLHILLKHSARCPKDIKTEAQLYVWNIATLLELSNYYSVYDNRILSNTKSILRFLPYVAGSEYSEFRNMTASQIFNKLSQDQDLISKPPFSANRDNNDCAEHQINHSEKESLVDIYKEIGTTNLLLPEQEQVLLDSIIRAVIGGYEILDDEQKKLVENSEVLKGAGLDGIGVRAEPIKTTPETQTKIAVRKLYTDMKSYFIDQEHIAKARTYRHPNKKYVDSKIIMKGRSNVYKPNKTIAAYVDVSESMTYDKVRQAIEVIESLKRIKNLEVAVKYFNSKVHDEFHIGGGTSYDAVFSHAMENNYHCIALITDDTGGVLTGQYGEFEALWLIGIEPVMRKRKEYSLCDKIDSPRHPAVGNEAVNVKRFRFSVICPDPAKY